MNYSNPDRPSPQPPYPPPPGHASPASGGYPAQSGYAPAELDGTSNTARTGEQSVTEPTDVSALPTPTAATPAAAPRTPAQPRFDSDSRLRRTRVSAVWIGLVAAGVLLVLLIIFIAQNLNDAPLHFFGFSGEISVGLALLLAGVCGLLVGAVPASIRIWQLRKALRKSARHNPIR